MSKMTERESDGLNALLFGKLHEEEKAQEKSVMQQLCAITETCWVPAPIKTEEMPGNIMLAYELVHSLE